MSSPRLQTQKQQVANANANQDRGVSLRQKQTLTPQAYLMTQQEPMRRAASPSLGQTTQPRAAPINGSQSIAGFQYMSAPRSRPDVAQPPNDHSNGDSGSYATSEMIMDSDERFFESHQLKSAHVSQQASDQNPREHVTQQQRPFSSVEKNSGASQYKTGSLNHTVASTSEARKFTSENVRIVYEHFRNMINPKSAPREGTPDVSGILAKKVIDR